MNTTTSSSLHITAIRDLAKSAQADQLKQCLDLAVQNQPNPCYQSGGEEQIVNILAKATYVSALIRQGKSLNGAMRQLGKSMRTAQQFSHRDKEDSL